MVIGDGGARCYEYFMLTVLMVWRVMGCVMRWPCGVEGALLTTCCEVSIASKGGNVKPLYRWWPHPRIGGVVQAGRGIMVVVGVTVLTRCPFHSKFEPSAVSMVLGGAGRGEKVYE